PRRPLGREARPRREAHGDDIRRGGRSDRAGEVEGGDPGRRLAAPLRGPARGGEEGSRFGGPREAAPRRGVLPLLPGPGILRLRGLAREGRDGRRGHHEPGDPLGRPPAVVRGPRESRAGEGRHPDAPHGGRGPRAGHRHVRERRLRDDHGVDLDPARLHARAQPVRGEGDDQARRLLRRPLDGAWCAEARGRSGAGERGGSGPPPLEPRDAPAPDPGRSRGDRGEAAAPGLGRGWPPRREAHRGALRLVEVRGAGAPVIKGRHYRTGAGIAVSIKEPAIAGLRGARAGDAPYIGPGIVDLQINGFRGLDFNTLPVADDLPGNVTRELWSEGVTSYLATVITN